MLEKQLGGFEDENSAKKPKKSEKEGGKKMKQTSILSFSKSNGSDKNNDEEKEKMSDEGKGSNEGTPERAIAKKRKHDEMTGEVSENTLKQSKLNQ